jgi:hypothetical protein
MPARAHELNDSTLPAIRGAGRLRGRALAAAAK